MRTPISFGLGIVLLLTGFCAKAQSDRGGFNLNSLSPDNQSPRSGDAVVADIRKLHAVGAEIVRYPMFFSYVPSLETWLTVTDEVLTECERDGMTLVIDVHHPTPGKAGSTISNPDDFVHRWQQIASRYKDRGAVWYGLCNEPTAGPNWQSIALAAAQAIRQVDTRHAILYAPGGDATTLAKTCQPLPDIAHQVFEFHWYDWHDVQFHPFSQNGDHNLHRYPSANRTYANLKSTIATLAALKARTHVPVFVGEVGITWEHPDAPAFMRDFTGLCDYYGIPVSLFIYNGGTPDLFNVERNSEVWRVVKAWLAK